MKFITDLNKGILGQADSTELWEDILSHIPDEVLLKPDVKILSVACGHCTEAVLIAKRMMALGISKEVIQDSIYLIDKYQVFTNPAKSVYGFKHVITEDFLTWNVNLKFDVVIGNPPYQDGTKSGGQNKIYNQFSKKALALSNCIVAFVTPASVCKKSKRFSIVGQPGLCLVNFTATNYFNVGAKICYWIVNKSYQGDVLVQHSKGTTNLASGEVIYDYGIVDKEFSVLYNNIRAATKKPATRMFKHNSIDMSNCRSPDKTDTHVYPMYKLNSNETQSFIQFNSVKPKLHQVQKLTVAITKSFCEKSSIVDIRDYDMAHVATEVSSDIEIANIKSFIFSEYFIEFVRKWKEVDGYGYNYALLYLPKFDKTKHWTNNEVKEFIERFCK